MRNTTLSLLISAFILSLMINSAPASAENRQSSVESWVLKNLANNGGYYRVRSRETKLAPLSSIRQKFLEYFDQSDYGFDGITAEDIEIQNQERSRNSFASALTVWFRKDIDQDLVVTKSELEIFHQKKAAIAIRSNRVFIAKTREQIIQILNELVARDLVMDTNKDKQITLDEAVASIKQNKNHKRYNRRRNNRSITMDFDIDNNERVEREEYLTGINNALLLIDENKDGFISEPEFRSKTNQMRKIDRKNRLNPYRRIKN